MWEKSLRWLAVAVLLMCLGLPGSAVAAHSPIVSQEELLQAAVQYLHNRFASPEVRLKVSPLSHLKRWVVGGPFDSLAVTAPNLPLRGGYTPLTISAKQNGKVIRSLVFAVDLHIFQPVLVAQSRILPRTPLKGAPVVKKEVDVSRLHSPPLHSVAQLAGKMARRVIQPAQPLTEADVMPVLLIQRGEKVTLQYNRGSLHIELTARALQDGAQGEVIWLLNPQTRQRIQGRVVDRSLAIVP